MVDLKWTVGERKPCSKQPSQPGTHSDKKTRIYRGNPAPRFLDFYYATKGANTGPRTGLPNKKEIGGGNW